MDAYHSFSEDDLKEEHDDLQDRITMETEDPQQNDLLEHGFAETRKRTVPAYTFDRFRELPTELQFRIWSLAARSRDPRIVHLHRMEGEETNLDFRSGWQRQTQHLVNESSGIEYDGLWYDDYHVPEVLHVCRDSRIVAQRIYTLFYMRWEDHHHWDTTPAREVYVNTLYDSFYMRGDRWTDTKVLVDKMIMLNTTRPLLWRARKGQERFNHVRLFITDFKIFGSAPARVWAEFPMLEKLTIAIYPFDDTLQNDTSDGIRRVCEYVDPKSGTRLGKRADWVLERAGTRLQEVQQNELADWRIPELAVVVKKAREHEDEYIYDDPEDGDGTASYGTDDLWYQEAQALMAEPLTKKELSLLKQKHLPSKRIGWPTAREDPTKTYEDPIYDSETEGAHPNRPFVYDDWDNLW